MAETRNATRTPLHFVNRIPILRAPGRSGFLESTLRVLLAAAVAGAVGGKIGHGIAPTVEPSLGSVTAAVVGQSVWVLTGDNMSVINRIDPRVADRFFDTPVSYGLGTWSRSVPSLSWPSEAEFASDVREGRIPRGIQAVMYDPEKWPYTPLDEQIHPGKYMWKFALLAHRHGYYVIITPHPGLVDVPGALCQRAQGETREAAYLRCGIAADAARFADAYETQAQYLEDDVRAYRLFVAAATSQAKGANPGIVTLSGLSTGFTHSPEVLFHAYRSVEGVVDGHYLSLAGDRPREAAQFLEMVANEEDR